MVATSQPMSQACRPSLRDASARPLLSPDRAARRAESVAHLVDSVWLPEDASSLQLCNEGTFQAFRPRNSWEDWLGQQAAVQMFRINRCERIERRLRLLQSLRAIDCWEADQLVAIDEYVKMLSDDPDRAYANLQASVAGCDWLIDRWKELAEKPVEAWTEAQHAFAQSIHPGKASAHRKPGFGADFIALLQNHREQVTTTDQANRAMAETDLTTAITPEIKQVRRDRQAHQRHLNWIIKQFHRPQPDHRTDYRYRPDYKQTLLEPRSAVKPQAPSEPSLRSSDETNPTEDSIESQNETNPTEDLIESKNETNPTVANSDEAKSPQPDIELVVTLDPITERVARLEARRRRIDPDRAVKELRKSKRRSA